MEQFFHHHGEIYFHLILILRAIIIGLFIAALYWMGEKMSPEAAAFWKGVLSDQGNPSWSRVASSLLLVACVMWDTIYLLRMNQLTDGGTLSAQALFISSPYLINTTGKAAMMIATRPQQQVAPVAPSSTGDTTTVVVGK